MPKSLLALKATGKGTEEAHGQPSSSDRCGSGMKHSRSQRE